MKKRIILAIIGLVIVIAVLAGIKTMQIGAMIDQGKKFVPPPETVTSAQVRSDTWENALTAVGTLTAVQGVNVSAELSGKVAQIAFESGSTVRKGALLLRQDTSSEGAQLPGAEAQVRLTKTILERDAKMLDKKIISQSEYDTALANYDQARAQAANIRATIAKKTIRAPFSGRLGIRQVNLGQILREGDPIVTLQAIDPIHADFTIPQQQMGKLRPGLPVGISSDAVPGMTMEGRIKAINPLVDTETRNIKVQAVLDNHGERLRPGMFVNVSVGLPVKEKVLTIPATAVLYAPYGDSVFVITEDKEHKGGKVLRQQFIRLAEKRGDFIAVASGLKEGEEIVSTGVFKLRNGQSVIVDNRLALPFSKAPKPENN
jgi:membrane fusion protein (multidrug efflux system)